MQRVVARDESALRVLFNRHSAMCFTVCLRVLSDRNDAEIVLIDVFAEVWRTPMRFNPERGSVVGYLVVLARSRAIDHARTRKQPHPRSLKSDDTQIGHAANHPASEMMADERRASVRAAVRSLPDNQREAVELAFFAGMTHTAIAEKLERPEGTVKSQIRQGLIRLREILKDEIRFD